MILGGSGFVGANVMRELLRCRDDIYGTATRLPAWRLQGLPIENVKPGDLLIDSTLDCLLDTVHPRTILDCMAYGAYSFEQDSRRIYQTNFDLVLRLLERLDKSNLAAYIHAGSSSEYGYNASGPTEDSPLAPNSHYAVSKVAACSLIYFYGKKLGLPCANLRLYSVYGPFEDASRLIPNLVREGLNGRLPEFVHPAISRDFIYTEDVVEAFVDCALNLTESDYGESFNIGTGYKTTIGDCASLAKELFGVSGEPAFSMASREWDLADWYANIDKARSRIGWQPRTSFREGLIKTIEWFRSVPDLESYFQASKRFGSGASAVH